MNVNFPENLTDDFLGLFVGITATLAIIGVIFIGPDDLADIALGALVASLGVVLNGFIKSKGNDGNGSA